MHRSFRRRETGEGDRPKGGGGDAGRDELHSAKATRGVRRPLHHASHGPPPPLWRGRKEYGLVLAAPFSCVRVLPKRFPRTSQSKKGGGAPTGASIHCPRHTSACCHANVLRRQVYAVCANRLLCAEARHTPRCCHLKVLRARSPLGAPLAVLAAQINATAQPRPRFARTGGYRCYPHHRSRLQRCTSRTGHNAGRSMPKPPGSGVTKPARRNRTRSVSRPSPVTSLCERVHMMTFERQRKVK